MEENQYKAYLTMICSMVNRNYNFSISVKNIELYGLHKYSEEKVYKVTMTYGKHSLIFYVEADAFERWSEVPWSGQRSFRPDDWDKWEANKKLITAWCWCIYKYYTEYTRGGKYDYQGVKPEILE